MPNRYKWQLSLLVLHPWGWLHLYRAWLCTSETGAVYCLVVTSCELEPGFHLPMQGTKSFPFSLLKSLDYYLFTLISTFLASGSFLLLLTSEKKLVK